MVIFGRYSPLTNLYIKKILNHVKKFGGGFLVVDYGPYVKKDLNYPGNL